MPPEDLKPTITIWANVQGRAETFTSYAWPWLAAMEEVLTTASERLSPEDFESLVLALRGAIDNVKAERN